ncbi:MAG: S-layer homology domain-containing protein [Clostridia bacterium]|nr:S-layer homology domain-containing protein [Clostridia bacterium]
MKLCDLKRLIVAFLIVSMIIPTGVFAVDEELYIPDCSYQASTLEAIGVLDNIDKETMAQTVTRGVAAHNLAKLLGVSGVGNVGQFTDVTEETEYAKDIGAMADMGIIKGSGNGLFEPDRQMTLQEFIKMLVSAMGYGVPAERAGGYPAGYVKIATGLDLFENVEKMPLAKPFSTATMAVVLYNSLDAEILSLDGYVDNGMKLKVNEKDTVLTAFLKYKSGKGVVEATELSSLTTAKGTTDGQVIIDGVKYFTGAVDMKDMLGYLVDYYYSDDYNAKTIVYAEISDKNDVLEVESKDILDFSGMTLYYQDENGKEEEADLTAKTDVIYNNRPAKPITKNDIHIKNGKVVLIDNDADGNYDVVKSTEYRIVYAKQIDYINQVIHDEYDAKSPIDIGKAGKNADITIISRKGNEIELDNLEYDSLLSCIISRDGSYAEITEVVDEIIGVVDEYYTEEGKTYVTLNGKLYEVCAELQNYGAKWELGDKLICYLDSNGRIGVVRDDKITKSKWAYLEGVNPPEEGIKNVIKIRVLEQDSDKSLSVYECAGNVKIDNTTYKEKDTDKLETALKALAKEVIRFALDSDGKVSKIETSAAGFTKTYEYDAATDHANGLTWDSSISLFEGKVGATGDTTVFMIPDNGDVNKYKSSDVNNACRHFVRYKIDAYALNEDAIVADILVFEAASTKGSAIKDSSPVMMVKEITTALDSDKNATKRITGYVNGEEVSYIAEDDTLVTQVPAFNDSDTTKTYSLKCGDLIQIALDGDNVIVDSQLICRGAENLKVFSSDNPSLEGYYSSGRRTISGWVYQTDGSFFTLSTSKPTDATVLSKPEVFPVISSIGVYIYDTTKGEVKVGSVSDILSYKTVGDNCSQAVVFMESGDMLAVVLLA